MSLYTLTFESSDEYYYSTEEEEEECIVKKPVVAPASPRNQSPARQGRFVTKSMIVQAKPQGIGPNHQNNSETKANVQKEKPAATDPKPATPKDHQEKREDIRKSLPNAPTTPFVSETRRCHREKAVFKKTRLTFFADQKPVLNTAIGDHQAIIYQGDKPNENPVALLHFEAKKRRFSLVRPDGEMVMFCECKSIKEPISYSRFFISKIWVNRTAILLRSELPRIAEDGRYVISFGGKFTKHSFRNSILLAPDNRRSLVVRKIAKNDLEVENFSGWDDLTCFGFAIIAYTCPY